MTFKYFNVPSLSYLITCLQLKSYVVISTKGEIIATDRGCYLLFLTEIPIFHLRLKRKHI